MPARPGRPAEAGPAAPAHGRRRRLRQSAAARGVPLATILVTVAVVALTYLAGKLAYGIRDVILMIVVAAFVTLIINPLVVALQRWGIRRRGWAVAIAAAWMVLVGKGSRWVEAMPCVPDSLKSAYVLEPDNPTPRLLL